MDSGSGHHSPSCFIVRSKARPHVAKPRNQKLHVPVLSWRIGCAPRHGHRLNGNVTVQKVVSRPKQSTKQVNRCDDEDLQEDDLMMPPPSTILKKGGSDPFDSAAVPVDAFVNDLLAFNKGFFEPFIMSMERGNNHDASYRNKLYQTSATALHDERTANANLARLAMIKLTVVDTEITRAAASRFMSKAYENVIHQARSGFSDPNIPVHILSLLSFEVIAKNYMAAAVHARILRALLLEMRLGKRPFDIYLLNSAIYMDMKRSLLSWTQPIILLEELNPNRTLSILPTVVARLERLGVLSCESPTRFDNSGIPSGKILNEFMLTLQLFRVGALIGKSGSSSRFFGQSTVGAWGRACAINFQRLFQLYLSAKTALAGNTRSTNEGKREVAVSLAIFYWVYSVGNFDFLDPTRATWRKIATIWSPTKRMLAELHQSVQAIDWYADPDAPPALRLWMLYVCTLAEQVTANIAGEREEGWSREHNKSFTAQALQLGLWCWDDVVVELQKYAYLPDMSDLSKPWFELCFAEIRSGHAIPHMA